MKRLENLIDRIAVQKAVYWSSPTPDGYGGYTFDDPVELDVRWRNVNKVIATAKDEQYVCKAEVIVKQDVDVGGYICLGSLDEIDSSADPYSVGAYEIVRFDKIPALHRTDEFIRRAYL